MYNLCRLNKARQIEAAQAGIIPCLKRVIETSSPLKQFALPILCDMASAGKSCLMYLQKQDGLGMYIQLLKDPYFQVSGLEAIVAWYGSFSLPDEVHTDMRIIGYKMIKPRLKNDYDNQRQ